MNSSHWFPGIPWRTVHRPKAKMSTLGPIFQRRYTSATSGAPRKGFWRLVRPRQEKWAKCEGHMMEDWKRIVFLWLLCNILMTYGKLWICILLLQLIINYFNSICLYTATDSDLVHCECIPIYSIICVLCLHSYISCMFIKSTYTNIDFCIITIRNIE